MNPRARGCSRRARQCPVVLEARDRMFAVLAELAQKIQVGDKATQA